MIRRFIDAKQFQRLRNIKQLGTTDHVIQPNTSYSRFEHCLGVSDLARLMASHLKARQPQLEITDRDVDCVEIAGLCHDLGHGPWSHLWDGLFIPAALKGRAWSHEEGSEMMFDALVEEGQIPISVTDQLFVKALIAGDHLRTPHEKEFLFDIIANKRNGFDVDKFDYIHRDCHLIGDPMSVDKLSRLVESARVIDNQICYDIKDASHIYDLAASRFKLYKEVYNHKTSKAINYMIIDALIAAEPSMQIARQVYDPKKYLTLTDEIMPQIESTTDPSLAEARAIFRRIRTRDLYECVATKTVEWPLRHTYKERITGPRIVEAARNVGFNMGFYQNPTSLATSSFEKIETLEDADVIVDFSTVHYGMKEKNPMDFVRFYSVENPDISVNAEHGLYSGIPPPTYFAEVILSIYAKKSKWSNLVWFGYHAALANIKATIDSDGAPFNHEAHSKNSSIKSEE